MENKLLVVPQVEGNETFVELTRAPKTQGRTFKKHILSEGTLYYGGQEIPIDSGFMASLVTNFKEKKCDIVQVPIVNQNNQHTEDPRDNAGEVVDLELSDGKLYAIIDSRIDSVSDAIGKTILGASAMLSRDYTDNSTGLKVGPTLLHVALTNRPHVLNLEDFQEYEQMIAASSGKGEEILFLTETPEESSPIEIKETKVMNHDELISELKTKHGVDVEALTLSNETLTAEVAALKEQAISTEQLTVSLSNTIKEHLVESDILSLSSANEATAETLIASVTEAGVKLSSQATEIVQLSGRIESLETSAKQAEAAHVVDELIGAGKIMPAQREAMLELRLTNAEIFDKIVPDVAIIELSGNSVGSDSGNLEAPELIQAELDRLIAI